LEEAIVKGFYQNQENVGENNFICTASLLSTIIACSPSAMIAKTALIAVGGPPHEVLQMNQEGFVISQGGWVGFVVG